MAVLSYIFLILYIIGIAFFIKKNTFFSSQKIQKKYIVFAVIAKMIAGIIYVLINNIIVDGGDIVNYYNDGNIIFNELSKNPYHYLKLIFHPNNVEFPLDIKETIFKMGYWHDSGAYMVVRFNALIRLISFGNIYIHALFSGFFSFLGSFLIFKVFEKNLKVSYFVFISIFFFPSLLFWTSGIHKEFISVLALGMILYNFFILVNNIYRLKNIIFFCIGIGLFFFTRNYMLLALMPSLISYFIYKKFHIKYNLAVLISLLLLIVFMNYQKIPGYNKSGFEVVLEKRIQFENLKHGNTSIVLEPIEANFFSLLKNIPNALFNTIFRPHFSDIKSVFLAFASVESLLLTFLIIIAAFNFHNLNNDEQNFVIFMILYSISLLIIIGWIVPNLGAIVRYRSISLILLIPSLFFVISKNKRLKF